VPVNTCRHYGSRFAVVLQHMLKKRKQYEYVEERQHTITDHLRSFKSSRDPEHLHVVRVQMKKTIALLHLYGPLKKHAPDSFRKVFKHAGLVRDAAVVLKLIEKHQPENAFLNREQHRILNEYATQFELKADEYIAVINDFYSSLLKDLRPISRKKILKVYRKDLEKIAAVLEKKRHEGKLHNSRKRLKKLLYLYTLLPKKISAELDLNVAYIDTLQDIIGKWHDAAVADELFFKYKEINAKFNTKKLLKSIRCLSKDFIHKSVLAA